MAQVRLLQVRLNRGVVRIRYMVKVERTLRVVSSWWIEGADCDRRGLDTVERIMVEALIYADVK